MKKTLTAAAAAASLVLLVPSAASADDVAASSIDFQVVAEQNTIVLTVGESASVTLTYSQTNDDGKSGCNLQGSGSQLTLDVVGTGDPVDGPAGLSGMPEAVVFESCDDATGADSVVVLNFAGVSPGTTTFTFSRNAAGTVTNSPDATYDTSGATFVVTVLAPQEQVGRDAPAVANDWLHNTATLEQLAACRALNGTNKTGSNWHGQLIGKVAQHFEGQSFSTAQEQVVVDQVKAYCGL